MGFDFGQMLQGIAGGALGGSAFGPLGAAIGGGLGGLGAAFGDQGQGAYQDTFKQLADKYGNRQAPQFVAAQAGDSGFRQNQAGLISQLESMARGNGPSAAALQMREAMDRAAAAQASGAAGAGGRGVNAGAALRNATNNTAALQQNAARDTALARVQEQLGATGMLGQVLQGARGQDLGLSQFNAGQTNQMNMANLQALLQQLQLNQQGQLSALGAAAGAAGPGTGTQLLAGGASALPAILQMAGGGPKNPAGQPTTLFNWGYSGTNVT